MGDLWRAQGAAGRHQAQRCYATALRLDQTYAPAWRGLGDLLREDGNHGEAVSCYQARSQGSDRFQDGQSAVAYQLRIVDRAANSKNALID